MQNKKRKNASKLEGYWNTHGWSKLDKMIIDYFEQRPALFETNYKKIFDGVYYSEIICVNSYLAGFSSPG